MPLDSERGAAKSTRQQWQQQGQQQPTWKAKGTKKLTVKLFLQKGPLEALQVQPETGSSGEAREGLAHAGVNGDRALHSACQAVRPAPNKHAHT